MYIYVFFILAAVLAIPTYGASLLIFFLLKSFYDNRAVSAILNQANISMRDGLTMELFRVNRAAINKLFERFCLQGTEGGTTVNTTFVRWGLFSHPMIAEGRNFSLRVMCLPRGAVDIKAAPGINHKILSDHLEGIGSFRLAALGKLPDPDPEPNLKPEPLRTTTQYTKLTKEQWLKRNPFLSSEEAQHLEDNPPLKPDLSQMEPHDSPD